MKSRPGLVALFAAWLLATLFVALFFNGGGLSTHTPSLHRTPIAVWFHNDAVNVKLTKEVFNTPTETMAAPTSTNGPATIDEEVVEVEVDEQELQLWQECIQDPAKRDEVYASYLNKAKRLKLIGDASGVALGAHLARARAFIEQFNKGESNDTKLSFKTFCAELGLGVDAAKTLMINGTNIKKVKAMLGQNPDTSLKEIAQDFVSLSNTNIFRGIMADEAAATTIHTELLAQKLKRAEPTKATVDTAAYPSIPANVKKELMSLQGKKKQKMNNPRVREVMTVVDKAMREKNKSLNAAYSATAYQKKRRKSDMLMIAESIQKNCELYFENVCDGEIGDLPKRFVVICTALRDGDESTLDEESESIEFEKEVPNAPPSLEAITPANIPSEEKTSEVPPPPMNETTAATELPATEAPVEMAIVDRDDATGIMTGVTSALGGLMTSVFGTSDRESRTLIAQTLDEGKHDHPAKNYSVGTKAKFGQYHLVVKSRSDGVHFWRRL